MAGAKIRLDRLLVQKGLFENEEMAKRCIMAREVKVDDVYASSPAAMTPIDANIECKSACPYVSRGGYKLKAAIDCFEVKIREQKCLDIGSSTGGFSDCLLQEGAASVTCVDVNYGQLAWKIRNDSRTVVYERTNIKNVVPQEIGAPFDIIVADLSFIGLANLAGIFC